MGAARRYGGTGSCRPYERSMKPAHLTVLEARPDLRAALSLERHTDDDYRALADAQKARARRRRRNPKVFSPWSQCFGKRKYTTLEAARKAAKRMGKPGLTWYGCVHCGTHHVGRAA